MAKYQIIDEGHVGLLYDKGRFEKVLRPGRHNLSAGRFRPDTKTVTLARCCP